MPFTPDLNPNQNPSGGPSALEISAENPEEAYLAQMREEGRLATFGEDAISSNESLEKEGAPFTIGTPEIKDGVIKIEFLLKDEGMLEYKLYEKDSSGTLILVRRNQGVAEFPKDLNATAVKKNGFLFTLRIDSKRLPEEVQKGDTLVLVASFKGTTQEISFTL